MNDALFSIRMRASLAGTHISGAERIVGEPDVARVSAELVERARGHGRGTPDSIVVTMDSLAGRPVVRHVALPVTDVRLGPVSECRDRAVSELVRAGVSEAAARSAMAMITGGDPPDRADMSGAMVLDALTGERLDAGGTKGVRARAVDYDRGFLPTLEAALVAHGLHGTRIREALALATKVAHAPGAVAELCVSDNPGYVTGYVASGEFGYTRLTPLKGPEDISGGRVFFVCGSEFDPAAYLHYMRDVPVLVHGPLTFMQANYDRPA